MLQCKKRHSKSPAIFTKFFSSGETLTPSEEEYAKQVAGLILGNNAPYINGRKLYLDFALSIGMKIADNSKEFEMLNELISNREELNPSALDENVEEVMDEDLLFDYPVPDGLSAVSSDNDSGDEDDEGL
jgi:chorismate mutase